MSSRAKIRKVIAEGIVSPSPFPTYHQATYQCPNSTIPYATCCYKQHAIPTGLDWEQKKHGYYNNGVYEPKYPLTCPHCFQDFQVKLDKNLDLIEE
jgi:hypothetical protein